MQVDEAMCFHAHLIILSDLIINSEGGNPEGFGCYDC